LGWQHCWKNIEFEEGKKIVQQWYFGDQPEASIVTIILHPHSSGTSAELSSYQYSRPDYEESKKVGMAAISVRYRIL